MAGQLIRRGEDRWLIRWFNGRDAQGKRRYGAKTTHGTKRDAQRALREVLRQRDLGVVVESRAELLDRYLDRWLAEGAGPRLRERTLRDYREMLARYVRPALGAKRLDRLTPLDVQAMVNALSERGLAPQTVRHAHAILSGALRQAVRWQLIPTNPAGAVDLPRRRPREMRALTSEEVDRLRTALEGSRYEALFVLLLGTGLRPSEALALTWDDLDLAAGRVVVRRSLQRKRRGEEWRTEEPKTAGSRRVVPLPATVVRTLAAHRKRQAEERLAAGPAYRDRGLVFATTTGEPLDHRNLAGRHFKPALARAGLPPEVRLYDLRHTFATLALGAGAHVKVVSERLGHASAKMTLDVYSHVHEPMQADATARLEAVLFGRD